ncbi:hypothetical protein [Paraburkholderia phytofirmans]|uniref:hypothetical protein n=1 Tax=Paraburkholderia phytofirmans TaxID=261302 RepID=UPI0038BD248E
MIFNVFLSKLQQKVLGRRESGIVSFVTGFSPRAIKRLERKEDAVATLHKAILERKRSSLMNEGLSWDEATALMAQIPSFTGNTVTPRPLCDLVFLSPVQCRATTRGRYRQPSNLTSSANGSRLLGNTDRSRPRGKSSTTVASYPLFGSPIPMRIRMLCRNQRLGALSLPRGPGKRWMHHHGPSLAVRCSTGWRAGMSTSA